jgi:SAM-dependent methyltransferase
MKKMTYDIEWNLERVHWWFAGRRKLLKWLFASLSLPKESWVIDIGCGVGSNLRLFQSMGSKLIGIDSEIYSLALARKRLAAVPLVNGDLMRLPFKPNSIDLIIATDILEHLDKDTNGIKEIHDALKRKGRAIFTVPAFESLRGIQDIVGMHKRRYSKKELIRKIEGEGFKILRSSYFNFFLFFPILIARRMIHLLGLKTKSENEINHPLINFFLKRIFSIEPYFLKYFSFPFGVSIFCIVKKAR